MSLNNTLEVDELELFFNEVSAGSENTKEASIGSVHLATSWHHECESMRGIVQPTPYSVVSHHVQTEDNKLSKVVNYGKAKKIMESSKK